MYFFVLKISSSRIYCSQSGHLPLFGSVNFFGLKTGTKFAMTPIVAPRKTVAALGKSRSVTYNLAPVPDLRHTLEIRRNVPISRTFVCKLPQKKAGVARLRPLGRRLGAGPLTCFIFDPRKYPFKSSEISDPAAFSRQHNGQYPLLGYLPGGHVLPLLLESGALDDQYVEALLANMYTFQAQPVVGNPAFVVQE